MRRFAILGLTLAFPAFLLVASPGCGKKTTTTGETQNTTTTGGLKKDKSGVAFRRATKKDVALTAGSWDGVIKGQVVFEGTPPKPEMLPPIKKADEKRCHEGVPEVETINQTWIVDSNTKGVANVVVFLIPPEGQYFPFDPEKEKVEPVVIKQPHCAFLPHVSVVFPVYWDGKKHVKTGQGFKVVNNAPFPHNSQYQGGDAEDIGSSNLTLKPEQEMVIDWKSPSEKAVKFSCQLHPWMSATVWSLDHPYAAVTNAEGKFEIKNVPTGVDLMVGAWHESHDATQLKAFDSAKVKVEKGKSVEKNFKISAH
jgi:hypothetical protein